MEKKHNKFFYSNDLVYTISLMLRSNKTEPKDKEEERDGRL
jgi:hypothetical protein